MKFSVLFLVACSALQLSTRLLGACKLIETIRPYERATLQDIVTWDENSLFVHGKRVLIYSGEFHPFRLPSPSLWLDIFQKMKSAGFNAASIYWDWALLEGQQGAYTSTGIFDVELLLQIAKQAGIYIIARPGPYINAEVSGGGFPGWLARNPAHLRTNETGYLESTSNFISNIGKVITQWQITNGGPIILVQPENEYGNGGFANGFTSNPYYIQAVEDKWRSTGIVMPFTDNSGRELFQPGSGVGAIDLYGFDTYPQGFSCNNPYNWKSSGVTSDLYTSFRSGSNSTPPMIPEFQGGSFDLWGGAGYDNCAILTNEDFVKVFYKNNFASGLKIVSYYMAYGGTNWGNIGYPEGYTSYDYGAAIKETREITRAKYSEGKLIANFLHASPAYLTASPLLAESNPALGLTLIPVADSESDTVFYVIRHDGSVAEATTTYKMNIPTSNGTISIPQIQGNLTLVAKDSKILLADYAISSYNVLYSSAEIYSQQNYSTYSVAIFYGGDGEVHEIAFSSVLNTTIISGAGVTVQVINGATVLNWQTSTERQIVKVGSNLYVYLIDRESAYNYWVTYLPGTSDDPFGSFSTAHPVIINGGYLIRNATMIGSSLYVTGDVNSTTTIEVIGVPATVTSLYFNGRLINTTLNSAPILTGHVQYNAPSINLPDLATLPWKVFDSLPELNSSYDDSQWTIASLPSTNNTHRPQLTTPSSLYATDYGYNTGTLVYRGHFTASGLETLLTMQLAGGAAFSASIWLNSTFLGSYTGTGSGTVATVSYPILLLQAGSSYVFTVVIDQTGFEENYFIGADDMKQPRGILSYSIIGLAQSAVLWKLTGNLHGESYEDKTRGPLNEGGMYAERQGYHLPNPPSSTWNSSSPLDGTTAAGVSFYTSSFDLNLPTGYDIPLYINFSQPTSNINEKFRCQLFINGWQFGKYVRNIGPQKTFPVPEGILNYQGTNYIAISLWSQDARGNSLARLSLDSSTPVQSGFGKVDLVDSPPYSPRAGAY